MELMLPVSCSSNRQPHLSVSDAGLGDGDTWGLWQGQESAGLKPSFLLCLPQRGVLKELCEAWCTPEKALVGL